MLRRAACGVRRCGLRRCAAALLRAAYSVWTGREADLRGARADVGDDAVVGEVELEQVCPHHLEDGTGPVGLDVVVGEVERLQAVLRAWLHPAEAFVGLRDADRGRVRDALPREVQQRRPLCVADQQLRLRHEANVHALLDKQA